MSASRALLSAQGARAQVVGYWLAAVAPAFEDGNLSGDGLWPVDCCQGPREAA
jgi:hypothetical protein